MTKQNWSLLIVVVAVTMLIIQSLGLYKASTAVSGFERNVELRAALLKKYDSIHTPDFYEQSYFIYYADSSRSKTDKAYADSIYNTAVRLKPVYDTLFSLKHQIDSLTILIGDNERP